MSLAIDCDYIKAVLVADEWYEIVPGSFDIDSYEFRDGGVSDESRRKLLLGGGNESMIPSRGFVFTKGGGQTFYGPLTSIQMVRT